MYTTILVPTVINNPQSSAFSPSDMVILSQKEVDSIKNLISDFMLVADKMKEANDIEKEKLISTIQEMDAKNHVLQSRIDSLEQQGDTYEQHAITYKQQISQLAGENAQLKAERPPAA